MSGASSAAARASPSASSSPSPSSASPLAAPLASHSTPPVAEGVARTHSSAKAAAVGGAGLSSAQPPLFDYCVKFAFTAADPGASAPTSSLFALCFFLLDGDTMLCGVRALCFRRCVLAAD